MRRRYLTATSGTCREPAQAVFSANGDSCAGRSFCGDYPYTFSKHRPLPDQLCLYTQARPLQSPVCIASHSRHSTVAVCDYVDGPLPHPG